MILGFHLESHRSQVDVFSCGCHGSGFGRASNFAGFGVDEDRAEVGTDRTGAPWTATYRGTWRVATLVHSVLMCTGSGWGSGGKKLRIGRVVVEPRSSPVANKHMACRLGIVIDASSKARVLVVVQVDMTIHGVAAGPDQHHYANFEIVGHHGYLERAGDE